MKPGTFVTEFAAIMGEDAAMVNVAYRNIREGLGGVQGRGANSTGVDVRMGARMLCWYLATDKPSRATDAVRAFGALPCKSSVSKLVENDFVGSSLDRSGLPAAHTLLDALQGILNLLRNDPVSKATPHDEAVDRSFRVIIEPSEWNGVIENYHRRLFYDWDGSVAEMPAGLATFQRRLRVTRTLDHAGLQAVATLLRDQA